MATVTDGLDYNKLLAEEDPDLVRMLLESLKIRQGAEPTGELGRLDRDVDEKVYRLQVDDRARRQFAALSFVSGPIPTSSLGDALGRPRTNVQYRIDTLLGYNHNATLTAQYKTGKTSFMCDLATSLVDGDPFLGAYAVTRPAGRVGFWNGEMDPDDFIDYFRPMQTRNVDRIAIADLREKPMPLLDDKVADQVVEWLKVNEVEIWLNDSWAKLCAWAGVQENDNSGVAQLAAAIDEIKGRAGVKQFITTVHTGRGEQQQGQERARGATALDDWVDARWVLTKQDGVRYLAVEGRRVELEETELLFDEVNERRTAGTRNRRTNAGARGAEIVREIVLEHPGLNVTALKTKIAGHPNGTGNSATAGGWINSAVSLNLVVTEDGQRNAKLHYPADMSYQEMAENLDEASKGIS